MSTERGPFFSNPFVARAARWGLLAWSVIGILILAYVVIRYVIYPFRVVFPPVLLALVIVYLLNPAVTALEARGARRILGALLVYIAFLAAVGLALVFLVPVLSHQVSEFAKGVPDLAGRVQRGLEHLAARLGVKVHTGDLVAAFESGGGASKFLGRVTSITSGVVRIAVVLVLGPLIAFYLLVDLPKIKREATTLIPVARRDEGLFLGRRIADMLGSFFRGQLVVAILAGLAAALGLWLVGLPYFAVFGALAGVLALVPLIGLLLTSVPTLFLAFATTGHTGGVLHVPGGWRLALACALVLVLVQLVDTRLLSPRLQSPTVRLHPVTVLLSLLLGGTVFGLWGLLFAVPVFAAGKVLLLHLWDTRSQWPPRAAPGPQRVAAVGGAADEPVPLDPDAEVLPEERGEGGPRSPRRHAVGDSG